MTPKTKMEVFYSWYKKNESKLINVSSAKVGKLFSDQNDNFLTASSADSYCQRIRRGLVNESYFYAEETPELEAISLEEENEPEPNFNKEFFESNMVEFPVSWAEEVVPYDIIGIYNLGICSDIHLPYHDCMALTACFSEFKKRKVDGIYLNGDTLDFEKISRFGKIPDGRYLKDEVEVGLSFLKSLRRMFPNIPIFWKDANHERRLQSYINEKCPELSKLYGMDVRTMMKLDELDITHIEENIVSRFGKLHIVHGHEIGIGSGSVNVARQVRLKTGTNTLCGHWHRASFDQTRNLADETHAAWSLGCLCNLKPRYIGALSQWSQGAATVELLNDKGEFRVNTFSIVNGKVI